VLLSPFRETFHTHRAFYLTWFGWVAVLMNLQVVSTMVLLSNHRRYYRLHRMRAVLLLRLVRVLMWVTIAAFPPMVLIPSTSFTGILWILSGALFHFDQVRGLARDGGWEEGRRGRVRCAALRDLSPLLNSPLLPPPRARRRSFCRCPSTGCASSSC
jgi:hypothetical protein